MKIVVYFETPDKSGSGGMYAEVVAQFASDDLYDACFPILEKIAKDQGFMVTESEREDEFVTDAEDDDTYDEFGVNTKNSFNTPPKEAV